MTKKLIIPIIIFSLFSFQRPEEYVENFILEDVRSGEFYSLNDLREKRGVVVVFSSNYCPYSKLYEERLKKLNRTYSSIQFLLINSNDPEKQVKESKTYMRERAEEENFPFPYLADKNQRVARMFNARKNPCAFLLEPVEDGRFKVVYKGAIDDNPQVPSDVHNYYLKNAIERLISGKEPPRDYVMPTGCLIKK